jgi:hypothetical protein
VPARESLARVLPVGPGRRFSARDPASPGIACSTLVPQRALLASARQSGPGTCAPSETVPRGTQAVSLKSVPHGYNCATVSLAPSESVPRGSRAVSAPRAVRCVPVASGRLPTEPSRATSVPASGPPGPQPSETQRARGGNPTPSVAGLRPVLSQAPSTAPQRPPDTDPDPGPRLRHWGLRHWPTHLSRRLTAVATLSCMWVNEVARLRGGATRAGRRGCTTCGLIT